MFTFEKLVITSLSRCSFDVRKIHKRLASGLKQTLALTHNNRASASDSDHTLYTPKLARFNPKVSCFMLYRFVKRPQGLSYTKQDYYRSNIRILPFQGRFNIYIMTWTKTANMKSSKVRQNCEAS